MSFVLVRSIKLIIFPPTVQRIVLEEAEGAKVALLDLLSEFQIERDSLHGVAQPEAVASGTSWIEPELEIKGHEAPDVTLASEN